MDLFGNPEFWVGVGIAIFLGILVWQRVPALVIKSLDDRADLITRELAEARRLREEAEALLAQYKAKRAKAEEEASAILTEAKAEAERFAKEARATIATQIKRRGKYAEERIAQAEAQAMAEVRGAAADAATAAAAKLIAAHLDDSRSSDLIKRGIEEIRPS